MAIAFYSAVLQLLMLTVMLVYLLKTLVPRRNSTCAAAPLPPGPTPWPIIGSLPEMLLSDLPAFRWIHHIMDKMNTGIACVKLGGVHVIPITCPAIAREVLKKHDANFASRPLTPASRTFSRGYMDAVMSPYGDHWRKMRRVLAAEVVSPARHAWLHGKRAAEADNLTRYVYGLAGAGAGAAVDVRHMARHYCGNAVRRFLFGTRYFGEPRADGGPGPLERQHVDAVFAAMGLLYSFSIADYLPYLAGLDLDGHERKVREAHDHDTVSRLHDAVIDDRRWRWQSGERVEVDDLLDVLITLKKDGSGDPALTAEEVKALAQDVTFAAMDNPSNAVEWAMAEMVSRPDMMEKAAAELDAVVGRDRLMEESDIPRLGYLKACIREAFRLHPVTPFNLPHVALTDATVAGYHVPKGSHVILSRIGLGRNPTVWEDPLRFDPDRHLGAAGDDVTLTENDLRFISFSTGRRGCIAASLGTAMSVMLFGRLLQGFSWRMPDGMAAVDLSESRKDLFMAKPLVLHAEPRLPAHLYTAISSM